MLEYSYPLYFLNWKLEGLGEGEGWGGGGGGREGAGVLRYLTCHSRAQRMKIRCRQRDFLQSFLLNFDFFVRLFKQSYSQSREDTISFIHTI